MKRCLTFSKAMSDKLMNQTDGKDQEKKTQKVKEN